MGAGDYHHIAGCSTFVVFEDMAGLAQFVDCPAVAGLTTLVDLPGIGRPTFLSLAEDLWAGLILIRWLALVGPAMPLYDE